MSETRTDTAPGGVTPWFQGAADTDTATYITQRGWHDKPAPVVALEAVKAYRELQTSFGKFGAADPTRIAVLPDPTKPEEVSAFAERLGRPKDATGYGLPDAEFAAKALELNLPKETAEAIAAWHTAEIGKTTSATVEAQRLAAAQAAARLEANWGANTAEFKMLAQKGASNLGWDEATIKGLEGTVGYDRVMDLMRFLGQMSSEGRFVGTDLAGGKSLVMTATEAEAKKADFIRNLEWLKDFSTNTDKQKQLRDLDEVIVSARSGHMRGTFDSHG